MSPRAVGYQVLAAILTQLQDGHLGRPRLSLPWESTDRADARP
jgi:S-adenosylmethionine synthetase